VVRNEDSAALAQRRVILNGEMASFDAGAEAALAGAGSGADAAVTGEVSPPVHICATPNCGKPATLACPTCLKLGLAPARFCNQDCFKSSWNDHKGIHKQVKDARSDEAKLNPTSIPSEFRGYTFTGSLRPCQQSPRRAVPDSIPKPDYADHPRVSASEH
jgi:hypothetical protein